MDLPHAHNIHAAPPRRSRGPRSRAPPGTPERHFPQGRHETVACRGSRSCSGLVPCLVLLGSLVELLVGLRKVVGGGLDVVALVIGCAGAAPSTLVPPCQTAYRLQLPFLS